MARRRRIRFATFGGRRNKPAYFLKFVFRILALVSIFAEWRNIPAYFLKFVFRIQAEQNEAQARPKEDIL